MTFFFISGFFIYNKKNNIFKDWIKLILNFLKTVFLPFIIIVIITLIFHDYFISKDTFISCIKKFDIKIALDTLYSAFIVHYDVYYLPGTAGHLWYVFSYAIIILVYPITRFVLRDLPKAVSYFILCAFLALMIVNDYYLFYGSPRFNTIFQLIPKPIFYSMWGHVLYNDVLVWFFDKTKKNSFFIINMLIFILSLAVYIGIFYALFKTQCAYYLSINGAYVYTSWLSTYALLMTTFFVIMIYDIDFDMILSTKIKKVVCYIAEKTLGIYLIHYLFVTKFISIGFQSIFANNLNHLYQHFIYHIVYTAIIFIISFITVVIIEWIKKLFLQREV